MSDPEQRVAAARKRKRASTPRSKNGCLTCRQRRVKCDERRPVCQRCTKAEFTCMYSGGAGDQPLPPKEIVSRALAALPVTVYNLPFSVPGSPDERKALHYYHNHAAMNLSGFVTFGFWNRSVLERCEAEPVVRHAIIALGHAHLEYSTQETLMTFSDSSLRAYCKAVRRLRKFIEDHLKPSRIVVLMCCIVFMTCDTLRREYQTARAHLNNGISVLRTWQQELKDNPSHASRRDLEDVSDLLIIFLRLDLGETLHDNRRKPQLLPFREKPRISKTGDDTARHPVFASTQDAVERYISMFHAIWIFLVDNAHYAEMDLADVPYSVRQEKKDLQGRIAGWLEALHRHRRARFPQELRHGSPVIECREDYAQLTELMVLDITWAQCISNSWLLAESLQDDDPKANVDRDAEMIFELAERYVMQKRKVRELNGRWDSRDLTVLVGVRSSWRLSSSSRCVARPGIAALLVSLHQELTWSFAVLDAHLRFGGLAASNCANVELYRSSSASWCYCTAHRVPPAGLELLISLGNLTSSKAFPGG